MNQQARNVRMVALESWTGAEGKVRRGREFYTTEERARELEDPQHIETSRGIDGRMKQRTVHGKPRARRVLDDGAGRPQSRPRPRPAPVAGNADNDDTPKAEDPAGDFSARLSDHSVAQLHDLRANLARSQEHSPTDENADAIARVDAELEARDGDLKRQVDGYRDEHTKAIESGDFDSAVAAEEAVAELGYKAVAESMRDTRQSYEAEAKEREADENKGGRTANQRHGSKKKTAARKKSASKKKRTARGESTETKGDG